MKFDIRYVVAYLKLVGAYLRFVILDAPPSLERSPAYQRFIRTPAILSFCLAITSWIVFQATIIHVSGWLIGGIACVFLFFPTLLYAAILREYFKRNLSRRRLWKWANGKFESWESLNEWIGLTPPYDLDSIAAMDDDGWEPAKGGGIVH